AQRGRAAANQVPQHAMLLRGGRLAVGVQEGRRVGTEDVGQLQRGGRHGSCLPVAAGPSKSSGLGVAATRSGETYVYRAVVRRLRWPKSAWMVRRSVPASSKCVANEWRSVWTVTCLARPARRAKHRQACQTVLRSRGRPLSRPKKRGPVGRNAL